jgi:predicted 3-demethylubiquinone-9 3-methyltransferase (glyoxalase superfamily)
MSALQHFPRITPFLWFDANAVEAVDFDIGIFKNSRRLDELRNPADAPVPKGSVLTVSFELDGQKFTALNGGPQFKFTPAISFLIHCKSQDEVDAYWTKLSAGGQTDQCGWLQDKFGLSWQVVPTILGELMADKDAARRERVMKAMLQMKKLDVEGLKRAAEAK